MELTNLTGSQGVLLSSWRDLKALLNNISDNSAVLDNPITIQYTDSGDVIDAYAAAIVDAPEESSDVSASEEGFTFSKELCLLLDC